MKSLRPTAFGKGSHRWVTASLLVVTLGLGACSSPTDHTAPEEETASLPKDRIEWFSGAIEEAFEQAESLGKPLFLYWGAEWCPPCHYLKNKIFSRPEFIERISEFVPVYLDGDTERAQIWGERLDVQGYPTVIVFNTSRQEVVRLSSSVPVDQYAAVLDQAVSSTRSIQEILDDVLEVGPASAATSDLVLLANYSWPQAAELRQDAAALTEAFRLLFEQTPDSQPVERSRFLAAYLRSLMQSDADGSGTAAEVETGADADLIEPVLRILADRHLREANLVFICYGVDSKIDFLAPVPGESRDRLVEAWQSAAAEIETDESLALDDRLGGTLARVSLDTMSGPERSPEDSPHELSGERESEVRDRVTWALEQVDDASELQSVVNTLAHILQTAGLDEEAENLLIDNMDRTTAPYYFMEWVADIREDAGDPDAALSWYRQAYETSRGSYSRFRYGSIYLQKLMGLQPDQIGQIEQASIRILTELLQHSDAFAGGNYSRLTGLESAYGQWRPGDEGKEDAIAGIRRVVELACTRFPDASDDPQRARCEAFLGSERSTQAVM